MPKPLLVLSLSVLVFLASCSLTYLVLDSRASQFAGVSETISALLLRISPTPSAPPKDNPDYQPASNIYGVPLCLDTDNGINPLVKGYVKEQTSPPVWDSCVSASVVKEGYCKGTSAAFQQLNCPVGHPYCNDGACRECIVGNFNCPTGQVCRWDGKCVPDGPVQANFKVYKLVSVNIFTGKETWQEIDLQNEQIELGLKVKFDATSSTGPAAFFIFSFGDGTYNTETTNPIALHQYTQSKLYKVELTVMSESGEMGSVTKTVYVDEGMEKLFQTSGGSYYNRHAIYNNALWGVHLTTTVDVEFLDLSNPYNTVKKCMIYPDFFPVYDFAVNEDFLFMVKGEGLGLGLGIHRADPNNCSKVTYIPGSQLGVPALWQVVAIGNVVYLAAGDSPEIKVFDFTNPYAPQLITTLSLPIQGGINQLELIGQKALAIVEYPVIRRTFVVDVRNPTNPVFALELTTLTNDTSTSITSTTEHMVAFSLFYSQKTLIVDLNIPDNQNQPINVAYWWDAYENKGGYKDAIAFDEKRLYGPFGDEANGGVQKYNIVDRRTRGYPMGKHQTVCPLPTTIFLHDPDGNGPQKKLLYTVGSCSGGPIEVFDPKVN